MSTQVERISRDKALEMCYEYDGIGDTVTVDRIMDYVEHLEQQLKEAQTQKDNYRALANKYLDEIKEAQDKISHLDSVLETTEHLVLHYRGLVGGEVVVSMRSLDFIDEDFIEDDVMPDYSQYEYEYKIIRRKKS